ncbi:MAG: hypothetical protein PVG53_10245 [Holophagae bacterium]
MSEELSIESLRAAITKTRDRAETEEAQLFERQARRFEVAVAHLVRQIRDVVTQVPELDVFLEDETESFSSPSFPGHFLEIEDQRVRITRDEDFLLFDPTAKALLSAMGQVEIFASRPIPFMVEKVLYLVPNDSGSGATWGYRSVVNLGGPLAPFGRQDLLKLLHAVFAAD